MKWSETEIEIFKEAVNKHGTKNWQMVATFLQNRDAAECEKYYKRYKTALGFETAAVSGGPKVKINIKIKRF